jgi:hypothetical protein
MIGVITLMTYCTFCDIETRNHVKRIVKQLNIKLVIKS